MSEPEPLDLRSVAIDETAARKLTAAQAHRMRIVAHEISNGRLAVGSDEPNELVADAARVLSRMPVSLVPVTGESLDWALARYYPDPVYPPEGEQVEALKAELMRQGIFGFELLIALAAQAILAGRDRLRIQFPWNLLLEQRDDPDADPMMIEGDVDDRENLYRHFAAMLEHAVAASLARGRPRGEIPLVFFGDRVYTAAVAFYNTELVIDLDDGQGADP